MAPQIYLLCIYMHLVATNMQKYAEICKHEMHMQNMQKFASPLC